MSSNINYASINENFPVAGQDNDTQVFRDNFDTIKNSLASAKSEVTDLQNNTAKLNVDNDFDSNKIANVVFQNVRSLKFDGGALTATPPATVVDAEINYRNGAYQVYRFGSNGNITLAGLPEDNYAKMVVELYGDGSAKTITFSTVGGTVIKKNSSFPGSFTVTSSVNPVIIEVWRHNTNTIYINYLGVFA